MNAQEVALEPVPGGAVGGREVNCEMNKCAVQRDHSGGKRGQEDTGGAQETRPTLLQHPRERREEKEGWAQRHLKGSRQGARRPPTGLLLGLVCGSRR